MKSHFHISGHVPGGFTKFIKIRKPQQLAQSLVLVIELDKHWNDNSSIRSDLRVNPRWRKVMYDNYEGRRQT